MSTEREEQPGTDELLEWLEALADSGDHNAIAAARQGRYDAADEHQREAWLARGAIRRIEAA